MTLHLAANPTSQSTSVAAPRRRRLSVSCWRVLVIVAVGVSVGLIVLPRGHAAEDDDDVAVVAGERQFVITEQQFDQMVFGGAQRQVVRVVNGVQQVELISNSTGEADFRKRVELTVMTEIQAVDRRVSLTEAQKKKLQLAGRGDVAQLLSRAAELRPKLTSKPMTQQQYTQLMKELQPLRMLQQFGIVGENSLFRKTLRRTLTDEQRVRFQTLERERQAAIIETALQTWQGLANGNGFMLTVENRQKFIELILDQGRLPQSVGPYGQYVVLLEADRLRESVKPLMSEAIWQKFETQLGTAKRFEPTLEMYGIWTARRSNDDDEATADATKDGR